MIYPTGMKCYRVCPGMNYRIILDKKGKFYALQIGNDIPQYKNCFGTDYLDYSTLEYVLKLFMVAKPEMFSEMYMIVQENDPEMFRYFESVVNSVGTYCKSLSSWRTEE